MRGLLRLTIATAAALITSSVAVPLLATAGGRDDLILTPENTLNGTQPPDDAPMEAAASNPMKIAIINNFSSSGSLTAYVTGRDSNNAVVFLSSAGTWVYPDAGGSTTPVPVQGDVALPVNGFGQTTEFTLPDYISAARVWVAEGTLNFYTVTAGGGTQLVEPSATNPGDPSSTTNWGFAELTFNKDGIYANISFVDFVGLVMGMRLTLGGGGGVQTVKGLKQDAIAGICNDLKAQAASDGQPWDQLCVIDSSGKELRVLSPHVYVDITPGAMDDYFDGYVDQVWSRYESQDLVIDTQAGPGMVKCRVSEGSLRCEGDNREYAQPTSQDIFGCNAGTFSVYPGDNDVHHAVVPRLCAAFNRATLLMDGGDVQPALGSDSYYQNSPSNHYSRIVHHWETDGLGYAFSYDDVNPAGQNEAGAVWGENPQLLEIAIGGFP